MAWSELAAFKVSVWTLKGKKENRLGKAILRFRVEHMTREKGPEYLCQKDQILSEMLATFEVLLAVYLYVYMRMYYRDAFIFAFS